MPTAIELAHTLWAIIIARGIGNALHSLCAEWVRFLPDEGMSTCPLQREERGYTGEPATLLLAASRPSWAEGLPEREAVKRANLFAGLSTHGVGTQKSFYGRARFDAELD